MMVQVHSEKLVQKDCAKDRRYAMNVLNEHANSALEDLEKNEKINPLPKDETCCEAFENWAKQFNKTIGKDLKSCPFCKTDITEERRQKYFTKEDSVNF